MGHIRELELNTELATCLNDAQAAKTIREANVQHKSTAHSLQQPHLDNMLVLEHEASLQVPISTGAHSSTHITPWSLQPTLLKALQMLSHPSSTQPQAPTKGRSTGFPNKLLWLQEKVNVAMEQLLPKWATMGFWHRELELNTELATCLNDAQAAKTIREANVQHKSTAHSLQQPHLDNMLVLEHEAMATEGWDHDWSLWGGSVDLPPGVWGALLYPPQILTSDIPLSCPAIGLEGRDMVPTSPTPGVLGTSAPQTGWKCQHCSCNQCTHS